MTFVLTPRTQRVIALVLAALVVFAVLVLIVLPVWSTSQLQRERVATLRHEALVLEGLAAVAPQYEAIAKTAATNVDARTLVYAAAKPSLAVAQLQGHLNAILKNAGVVVTASQALTEREAGGLTKIAVQATLEVEIGPLVAALHKIAAARPLLRVEKLTVREPDGDWALPVQTNVANRLQAELIVSAHTRQP